MLLEWVGRLVDYQDAVCIRITYLMMELWSIFRDADKSQKLAHIYTTLLRMRVCDYVIRAAAIMGRLR